MTTQYVNSIPTEIKLKTPGSNLQKITPRVTANQLSGIPQGGGWLNQMRKIAQDQRDLDCNRALQKPETVLWFEHLTPQQQAHIAEHILAMLGMYQGIFHVGANPADPHDSIASEYYEYAGQAVAQSGLPNAEDIFVRTALAINPDAGEQKWRDEYQRFWLMPRNEGVTIHKLLRLAKQLALNFDSIGVPTATAIDALVHGPDFAVYTPGNEDECRTLLDNVVSVDPYTFTLGGPGGPLAILRVPDKDKLPSTVEWNSSMPATTLAESADVMMRAERLTWVSEKRGRLQPCHPPERFVNGYITQMRGRYGALPLRGVARVPRIDDDGSVHFVSGYDEQSGLYHDETPCFVLAENPTREDALSAVKTLLYPWSEYRYEDQAVGEANTLAAIFTAIERPFIDLAPMFVVSSSMPGTGKGKYISSIVQLAFNTDPVMAHWGDTSEETEKRMTAYLFQSPPALCFDNVNGVSIKGAILESVLTEGVAEVRPFGKNTVTAKLHNRSFLSLTGNNPIITGDMARRAIGQNLTPRSADPERDVYDFDPEETVKDLREDLLQAAFTAMRAFRLAGMPKSGCPGAGSFGEWTRRVRDLVHWLTGYDVCEAFRQNKEQDFHRQNDAALVTALYNHFKDKSFTAKQVADIHKRMIPFASLSEIDEKNRSAMEVYSALEEALGNSANNKVSAKLFGYWARRVKDVRIGGFVLRICLNKTTNSNDIRIEKL